MKKYILLCLVSISFIAFTGCEESLEPKISDYDYLAFSKSVVDLKVDKGSTNSATYNVAVSKKSSSARTFNIVVDQTASTADPASYTIPASVTIPANSTSGTVKVDVQDINIVSSKILVLKFETKEGLIIGNDNKFRINLLRICVSNLAGNYKYSNGNGKDATVTSTGAGKYTVSGDNAFGTNYAFNISDACDILTVTGGVLPTSYGIANSGTGRVMANGDLEINYTVDGYFTNRSMILVKK